MIIELFREKVKHSQLVGFFEKLSILCFSGFSLLRALETLQNQEGSKSFKIALNKICQSIREGQSFTNSLMLFENIIPPECLSIICSGENSGNLDSALRRCANYMKRNEEFKKKFIRTISYPILVLTLSLFMVFSITFYLVPLFINVFENFNAKLPESVVLIVNILYLLTDIKFAFITIFAAFLLIITFLKKENLKIKLPFIGTLIKNKAVLEISNSLGEMLENGVPITKTIEIICNSCKSNLFKSALENIKHDVEDGEKLWIAFKNTGVFPKIFIEMVSVGEETGNLGFMLLRASEFYEREIENSLKNFGAIIEPAATIGAGVVVGVIIFSIFIPVISVVSALGN